MQLDFDHLNPLEPAARIFCAMQGQDPDEQMQVPHPFLQGVPFTRPAWHFPAENMLNLNQMLVAMKQAAQAAKPKKTDDPRQGTLFPTEH